jgi:hypothetical protein
LFLAAGLIGAQALVAFGYGVIEIIYVAPSRFVVGAGVTLLMLGYGVFLTAIARGVARGRRWSRGAGVATQLMQLLLAYSFSEGQTRWVGLLLGSVAAVTLICLLVPQATAAFVGGAPPSGEDEQA